MILFARKNIIIFIPVFKTISNLKISIKYIYTFYFLIKKSHFEKTKDIYIYILNIMRGKKDATTFPDKPVS